MMHWNDTEIEYDYAGLFSTDNIWIHPERQEVTYEIILVMEGTVFIEEDGVPYVLEKNDLMILIPGIVHRGYQKSHARTSFYWLHFRTTSLAALHIGRRLFHHYTNSAFFKQLLHVAHNPAAPPYGADAMLMTLLAELADLSAKEDSGDSKLVREAAEWVRMNASGKIRVTDIATRFGYNSEHFSRLFRQFYHMNLKAYICRQRVNYACGLLSNSSFSVKEIAEMMQFEDANQFIHFFQYHQKQSPTQFRNRFYHIHMNQ